MNYVARLLVLTAIALSIFCSAQAVAGEKDPGEGGLTEMPTIWEAEYLPFLPRGNGVIPLHFAHTNQDNIDPPPGSPSTAPPPSWDEWRRLQIIRRMIESSPIEVLMEGDTTDLVLVSPEAPFANLPTVQVTQPTTLYSSSTIPTPGALPLLGLALLGGRSRRRR